MKPGNVVQLRSGGPKMTIRERALDKDHWHVVWSDEHDRLRYASLPEVVLVPYTCGPLRK